LLVSIFLSDILPIFVIASAGFVLSRRMNTNVKTASHIVFYALLPCLVFNLFVKSNIRASDFGQMALLAVLCVCSMGVIGYVASRPLGLSRPQLSAFLLVVMISNGGNYGLPVVLFAFGTDALNYAVVFFVVSSILTNTLGVFIAAAGHKTVGQAIAGIFKTPVIYAVAAAALVRIAGITIPDGLARPVELLSDAALPLMIIVLGMQLDRAARPKRLAPVTLAIALSLLVAPIVAYGLTAVLGIAGAARQAGILLASMPVAVITTVLAIEFELEPTFVTASVLASTLLSPLTLTLLIAYLKQPSG
jgi:predicted permease